MNEQKLPRIYISENGIEVIDTKPENPAHYYAISHHDAGRLGTVKFQDGPVLESHGINGVTNETLLAVLIHRTEILDGKFPCRENKVAIGAMKQALASFEARTKDRETRGVEGTSQA